MPKYVLKSLLAGVFTVSFTVSPYAYADNKSPVNQVKTHIKDTKLTATKSYSEMFTRLSKQNTKVNPLVFKQLAEAFSHEKFPNIQVQEFKYKGKDALKVMAQIGKEQVVVEYLFSGDEVMKINGTVFKTADTASAEAFDRKLKSVEAFRKIYHDFQKRVFKAATIPTYEQWQKLTRAQRSEFYLRYRELLEAAYKVHGTGRFKVVSNSDKTFSEFVKASFLGEEAHANAEVVGAVGAAVGTTPPKPPGATDVQGKARQEAEAVAKAKRLTDGMGNPDPFQGPGEPKGPSCIVAGYARQWKGTICPWDGGTKAGADQFYKENPVSKTDCLDNPKYGKGYIACNPLIYGFNSEGGAHCINTNIKTGTTDNFNYATHGSGPCEAKSPLNSPEDKMNFIKNILAREKIPGADTLSVGPDPKCKAKTDGSCPNVVITKNPDLFKKIMGELSGPIATYIDSAKKICEENTSTKKWNYKAPNPPSGKSNKKDPAYQDDACDALLKRAIAVQNLLTTEETPTPPETVIASPCDGWTPPQHVEEAPDKKSCVCKDKPKCKLDAPNKQCVALDGSKPEYEGGEPVADMPSSPVKDAADCGSYFTRMNPFVSECSSTAGDWFKTFLGVVGGICFSNAVFDTHITGLCASKRKSASTQPPYVDPVAPCPATGCPTTDPVDPTPVDPEPPRTTETETNQTNPTYNPSQVPPR